MNQAQRSQNSQARSSTNSDFGGIMAGRADNQVHNNTEAVMEDHLMGDPSRAATEGRSLGETLFAMIPGVGGFWQLMSIHSGTCETNKDCATQRKQRSGTGSTAAPAKPIRIVQT
jgi:hypothetical protein